MRRSKVRMLLLIVAVNLMIYYIAFDLFDFRIVRRKPDENDDTRGRYDRDITPHSSNTNRDADWTKTLHSSDRDADWTKTLYRPAGDNARDNFDEPNLLEAGKLPAGLVRRNEVKGSENLVEKDVNENENHNSQTNGEDNNKKVNTLPPIMPSSRPRVVCSGAKCAENRGETKRDKPDRNTKTEGTQIDGDGKNSSEKSKLYRTGETTTSDGNSNKGSKKNKSYSWTEEKSSSNSAGERNQTLSLKERFEIDVKTHKFKPMYDTQADYYLKSPYVLDRSQNDHPTPDNSNLTRKIIFSPNRPPWLGSHFRGCEIDACSFTNDKRYLMTADAVLVHVCWIGPFLPPKNRSANQIWIAYGEEPPFEYSVTHLNPVWKSVFNWTMMYRLDSDIFFPYGFLVYRPKPPPKDYGAIFRRKPRMAAWLVGHCNIQSQRHRYVVELQKYIDVDIFGDCGPLNCSRKTEPICMNMLNQTYKFYLAFENSFCRDYVSEKYFKLFADVNTIPVVRGGVDYKRYLPPGTFIDTIDFDTPRQLAIHLHQLAHNEEAYTAMLWRMDHYWWQRQHRQTPCDLCKKLHQDTRPKMYTDWHAWLRGDGVCLPPGDLGFENHTAPTA